MGHNEKGFTLIEALTVLAISAILMGSMVPSMTHMLRRSQATAAHNWLIGSIMFARQTAISYGSLVTLCPSFDGNQCGGSWHDGTIVFIDRNRNARVDPKDVIMKRFSFPHKGRHHSLAIIQESSIPATDQHGIHELSKWKLRLLLRRSGSEISKTNRHQYVWAGTDHSRR